MPSALKYIKNTAPIVFAFLVLFLPLSASADITYPYTVDEKPQIIFGDSVPIVTASSTYYGMENYTSDYVNSYAHFTFTYTHHFCCYTSFPPVIYITNVDPTSTSTPIEKSWQAAYHIPSYSNIPTDWYLYDIQFDSLGYSVVVKQAGAIEIYNAYTNINGLSQTDWAAIANLHPPGNPLNRDSFAFTPIPIKASTPEIPNPVIIIPGIMGSAYKNGKLVIDPILHTYDDLIDTLLANGYVENQTLFTFPYEWRDSNALTANLLDDKITEVKETCLALNPPDINCEQVDLVAHSMGGLVARAYIQSGDYDQDVDQVIFLGTPHKGSQDSYLTWEGAEFQPGFFNALKEKLFKIEALRNGYSSLFNYIHLRPILSVQELLPAFDYLKDKDTEIMREYPNNYPQNNFLENLNSNIANLLNSGVEITNFVGNSGEDKTIERIRVIPSTKDGLWQHGEPDGFYKSTGDHGLERGLGDETVTIFGATLDSIDTEEIQATHRRIPTLAENRIFNILTGKTSSTSIDSGFNLSKKVLLLQLLSPIDFVITAPDGLKIGKNFSDGSEYNEIPNAFYSGYETNDEYITILNPQDGEYKVELQGTGEGKYEVLTSYISDQISTTTETLGITATNQITNLSLNVDNENPENLSSEKKVTLEILLLDIKGAYDLKWIFDSKTRDYLLKKSEDMYKNGKLDKRLAKGLLTDLKSFNKEKINELAYNLIKEDLEWLINN